MNCGDEVLKRGPVVVWRNGELACLACGLDPAEAARALQSSLRCPVRVNTTDDVVVQGSTVRDVTKAVRELRAQFPATQQ